MSHSKSPTIEVYSHVDCIDLSLEWLRERATEAMPGCLKLPGTEEPLLGWLSEIEVSLVSDETIAEVHGEFMDDPTPTDVITFHHGEILVSADTARREGPGHGHSIGEETLLYIIHGLLHLNGHTDLMEPERKIMHRYQDEVLREIIAGG
tara:strand:+ start:2477 stop:2926 length:450 start_codon:yes stop_codon:yes gene_type:complete